MEALAACNVPLGHADLRATALELERGGSWSPQQRLQKRSRDSFASESCSQETHSPGVSHATTASRAAKGAAGDDRQGTEGNEGALHHLSAVCHDALCANEAAAAAEVADAACKRRAVNQGAAGPNEQDSATSQALAFTMWAPGGTDAPATNNKPTVQVSPPPSQPTLRRTGLTSTAMATEEERLRCQAELATTRLLKSNSQAIIPQSVFLEAIQGGLDATDLFEFRWPRERQASRTSTILSLTHRQHGIMYALAGCADVMYVMSRVKAEVRETLQRLYAIDKINFYTWFKNRRLPLKRLLDRQAARAATAAKAESMGLPLAPPLPLSPLAGTTTGTTHGIAAPAGGVNCVNAGSNRPSDGSSSQRSSGPAVPTVVGRSGADACTVQGTAGGTASSMLGKRSLSDSMDMTQLRLPLSARGTNPEGPPSARSRDHLVLGHSPNKTQATGSGGNGAVAAALRGAQQGGATGNASVGLGAHLTLGSGSRQAAAVTAAVAAGDLQPVTLLLPKGSGVLQKLQAVAAGGDGSAAAAAASGLLPSAAAAEPHAHGHGHGAHAAPGKGLQLVQLLGGGDQVLAISPDQLGSLSNAFSNNSSAAGSGLSAGAGAKSQLLRLFGGAAEGGMAAGGATGLERLFSGGAVSVAQLAQLAQPQPQPQQQLCIQGADGQLHLVSVTSSTPLSMLQCQDFPGVQTLQQAPQTRLVFQGASNGMLGRVSAGGSGASAGASVRGSVMQQLVAQQQAAQQQQQQQQQRLIVQAAASGAFGSNSMQSPLVLLQQPLYAPQKVYTSLPAGFPIMSLQGGAGLGAAAFSGLAGEHLAKHEA